jgi:hypothetical protein
LLLLLLLSVFLETADVFEGLGSSAERRSS